ncbi:zinc finger SWIM domain-containing protein 3-like [Antedon mediterranea]|uniref:zinc finger SWIM domain-containing protein 3-like n=1 Tax=Antedon mediterranea TaxID=105859 RepID=UPI003AF70C7C
MTETDTIIDEACTSISDDTDQTALSLSVGSVFANWEEFKTAMEAYEANAHVKLIFADTRKIETANIAYRREDAPVYDAKFKYAYARLTCKHHGKYRSKGSGKRPNQRSYKTNCPMQFILSVDRAKDIMYIRSGNFTHNHPTDEDVAKLYPENRRLSKSERQFSKILMDMKVPQKVFCERVREMSQKPLTNKDIYNLQAQLRKEMAEEEKTEVQSLLHELQDITEKDSGSEVVVNVDGNGQIQVVFFQTSYMKEAYLKFPEVCIVGETDDINSNGMILCTIMVQDGSGTFLPCAHFLLAKLDEPTMVSAFQLFKQPLNDEIFNKPCLFIIGSSNLDVAVFQNQFPNASIKLCETQILKKFKNETMNIENGSEKPRRQGQLWTLLHAMVMSKTESEYEELRTKMQDLPFASAFNETWHQQRHLWVGSFRNKDLNYGIKNANNLVSFHEKVKGVVNSSSTVAECVKGILKMDNQMKLEANRKKLQAMMTTSVPIVDNPDLEELTQLCTRYAVNFLEKELTFITSLNVARNELGQLIITDAIGDKQLENDNTCSCLFYTNFKLPCKHIFAMRKFLEKKLFDDSMIASRWRRDYQHSECKVEDIDFASSPSGDKKKKRASTGNSVPAPPAAKKVKKNTRKSSTSSQSMTRDEKYAKSTLLCRQIAGIISEVPQPQYENKIKILKALCTHWLEGSEVQLLVKSTANEEEDEESAQNGND